MPLVALTRKIVYSLGNSVFNLFGKSIKQKPTNHFKLSCPNKIIINFSKVKPGPVFSSVCGLE